MDPPTLKKTTEDLEQRLGSLSVAQSPDLITALHDIDPIYGAIIDPVFVCLDCEAYERDQSKVTEIGVAVLDIQDLQDTKDFNWSEASKENIKSAHFRVVEYSKLVNKKFVHGCPEAYGFGNTTWVKLADVPTILKRIFEDPQQLSSAARFDIAATDTQRNVIVVGHGLGNDDKYLRTLGFSLDSATNIVGEADTQKLADNRTPASLKKLLAALKIDAVNLHNAGNDAFYTLQAFAEMLILKRNSPGHLNQLLREVSGKVSEKYDEGVVAPHIWGGTSVAGDEWSAEQGQRRNRKGGRSAQRGIAQRSGGLQSQTRNSPAPAHF